MPKPYPLRICNIVDSISDAERESIGKREYRLDKERDKARELGIELLMAKVVKDEQLKPL